MPLNTQLTRWLAAAAALAILVSPSRAQRPDSAQRPVLAPAAAPVDSFQPPISPRRAFLYSFLAPGLSQSVLGRHKAAAAFMLAEAISITMIRESGADVHEARRATNDSIIVSYVDQTGNAAVVKTPPRFEDKDVHTRAAHVEDWVAFLIANHLFAGADAFVAAHLWDVPARLSLRIAPRDGGMVVSAAFKWR